jgi:hypothetical protein
MSESWVECAVNPRLRPRCGRVRAAGAVDVFGSRCQLHLPWNIPLQNDQFSVVTSTLLTKDNVKDSGAISILRFTSTVEDDGSVICLRSTTTGSVGQAQGDVSKIRRVKRYSGQMKTGTHERCYDLNLFEICGCLR